jgi:hypothetical protein
MKGREKSRPFDCSIGITKDETMARKPKVAAKLGAPQTQDAQPNSANAGMFVLKRNHGLTINGRASKFYEAGTTFDPATDREVISHLVRSGARLEQVVTESESDELTEQTGDEKPENNSQNEEQE